MIKVLVTGGKGQLAACIKDIAQDLRGYLFKYVDIDELDISNRDEISQFFETFSPHWCINCAAYTAVDKAESELELAKKINSFGAKYLAEACKRHNTRLIQISTDFVFEGKQSVPYSEVDVAYPINVYGCTKLEGENMVIKTTSEHFIIRTSWLYSEYGNNFLKTMLRLAGEKNEISVVGDQIGTPTYAGDLAKVVITMILADSNKYGVYHYSNEGVASWYDFAKAIFDLKKIDCAVVPIPTEAYPTPAKRPAFSVMNKTKVKTEMGINIPYWRDSLKICLQKNN